MEDFATTHFQDSEFLYNSRIEQVNLPLYNIFIKLLNYFVGYHRNQVREAEAGWRNPEIRPTQTNFRPATQRIVLGIASHSYYQARPIAQRYSGQHK